MFTIEQYDSAIEALQLARKQKVENTESIGCFVCGGNCHPDYCGHNPLYAMKICSEVSEKSNQFHGLPHELSGFQTYMGEPTGPARVVVPITNEGER